MASLHCYWTLFIVTFSFISLTLSKTNNARDVYSLNQQKLADFHWNSEENQYMAEVVLDHQVAYEDMKHVLDEAVAAESESSTRIYKEPFNVSKICVDHSRMIVQGAEEQQTWALQMLDALGKFPSGVLQGDNLWLGTYKECVEVIPQVPDKQSAGKQNLTTPFHGQYCLATIGKASAYAVDFGVCVPNSCSESDVQQLVNAGFFFLPNGTEVSTIHCQPQSLPLDTPAIVVICFLSLIGLVLVAGTLYDLCIYQRSLQSNQDTRVNPGDEAHKELPVDATEETPLIRRVDIPQASVAGQQNLGKAWKVLLSFSIYTNGQKLLNPTQTRTSITAIHGIRFLSMTWVILGHTYFFMISLVSNKTFGLALMGRWTFQAISNATVSVDTFFLLSGVLATYLLCIELKKSGGPSKINWIKVYFHRFWRLTPPYMLLIAIWAALFKYMGEGPLWPSTGPDPNCAKYWWTNLLYINNIVQKDKMCFGWSWYLANDMQFFVVTPLMVVPLFLWWKAGMAAVLGLLLINIVTTGALVGVLHYTPGLSDAGPTSKYFSDVYITPWCRIGAYLVGVIVGYALYRTDRKIKLHWFVVLVCWLVAAGSALAVLYGLDGYAHGAPMKVGLSAFYNAMNRPVWALAVGWVIFACATGYGGFVNTLLSWPALVPLSRLTYMAYLVHPMVMVWFVMTRTTPIYLDDPMSVYMFLGHLVISYGLAFMLSLAFEAPMLGLEKVLLSKP